VRSTRPVLSSVYTYGGEAGEGEEIGTQHTATVCKATPACGGSGGERLTSQRVNGSTFNTSVAVRTAGRYPCSRGSSENAESGASSGNESGSGDEAFERVININNCPLCHRPRLNSKAERDIVTHLVVCASQDWARVNRVMVSNFVTAVQAQCKWYTNVLSMVSAGKYKIGAVE
jgi:hypothetical protein